MQYTTHPFYALVKALIVQHGYSIQKAFDTVWYSKSSAKPYKRFSDAKIQVWLDKVKHTPVVQLEDFKPKRKRGNNRKGN